MNKQHILSEIKRTAATNDGVPLARERFLRETGIKTHDWMGKFWARWGDALQEAGFAPNELQTAYDENVLIEKYIGFTRELGHFPVDAELRLNSTRDEAFPSHSTFTNRLGGSKHKLVASILNYCKGRAGYDDILALCTPIAAVTPDKVKEEVEREEVIGFIYLMKSGRHYKIGRSNAAGRREYELAIQMPERLVTVHTIRTDDPAGIEQYWHRRFEDKRKNGEWFDLTAVDVKAFKRRKFM
jgi:hypothetical protein